MSDVTVYHFCGDPFVSKADYDRLISAKEHAEKEIASRDALINDHLRKIMHLENRIEEEHYRGETTSARLRSMCEAMEKINEMDKSDIYFDGMKAASIARAALLAAKKEMGE